MCSNRVTVGLSRLIRAESSPRSSRGTCQTLVLTGREDQRQECKGLGGVKRHKEVFMVKKNAEETTDAEPAEGQMPRCSWGRHAHNHRFCMILQ